MLNFDSVVAIGLNKKEDFFKIILTYYFEFHIEQYKIKKHLYKVYYSTNFFYSVGGDHVQAGHVWKDYIAAVDSIVFLVDTIDRSRFAKAKEELDNLLTDEQIAGAPIVVLGTKSDLPEAATEEKLRQELGVFSVITEVK
ncbi:unnamed protein product [Rotaria sp. Silwood1]|nr:unnamed protein product [Rotaria sp. Silwood1]CAF1675425.1 unnamed protein product [Rotaria sp. Silwood1]